MPRKTIYQLCQSRSSGMLPDDEYLQARKSLLDDIFHGRETLKERQYRSQKKSAVGRSSSAPPAATEARRMVAKAQARQLQEIAEGPSSRSKKIGLILISLAVILFVLGGLGLLQYRSSPDNKLSGNQPGAASDNKSARFSELAPPSS